MIVDEPRTCHGEMAQWLIIILDNLDRAVTVKNHLKSVAKILLLARHYSILYSWLVTTYFLGAHRNIIFSCYKKNLLLPVKTYIGIISFLPFLFYASTYRLMYNFELYSLS